MNFNSLLTITEGPQGSNMASYVLIASLKKIYNISYLSTLTKQQLDVKLVQHASTKYSDGRKIGIERNLSL